MQAGIWTGMNILLQARIHAGLYGAGLNTCRLVWDGPEYIVTGLHAHAASYGVGLNTCRPEYIIVGLNTCRLEYIFTGLNTCMGQA